MLGFSNALALEGPPGSGLDGVVGQRRALKRLREAEGLFFFELALGEPPGRHDAVIGRHVLKWLWAAEGWPGADVVGLRRMLRPQGAEEQREAGVICLRVPWMEAEGGGWGWRGRGPRGSLGFFPALRAEVMGAQLGLGLRRAAEAGAGSGAETRAEAGVVSPKGLAPDGTCGSV